MNKRLSKFLFVVLAFSLCFALLTVVASADDTPCDHQGYGVRTFAGHAPGFNCTNYPVYIDYSYCNNCLQLVSQSPPYYGAILSHNFVTSYVQPTCTGKGGNYTTCTVCGLNYVTNVVAPLGHNYVAVETPPTCVKEGYTTHTCTRCSSSYRDYIQPLGHDWGTKTLPFMDIEYEACMRDGCTVINPHSASGSDVAITEETYAAIGRTDAVTTFGGQSLTLRADALTNPPKAPQVIFATKDDYSVAAIGFTDINTGVVLTPSVSSTAKIILEDGSGYSVLTGGENGMEVGLIYVFELTGGSSYNPVGMVILENGEEAVINSVSDGVVTTEKGTTFELSSDKASSFHGNEGNNCFNFGNSATVSGLITVKNGVTIPRMTFSAGSSMEFVIRTAHPTIKK